MFGEILIVIALELVLNNASNQEACPKLIVSRYGQESITWSSGKDSVVPSSPRCVDFQNKYVLNFCQNGSWFFHDVATLDCATLSSDKTCDESLLPLDEHCALVTLPQTFDAKCPKGFLKYYNYTRFDMRFEYWSSNRRFGDIFMHTGTDSMYGKEFVVPHQKTDCFVYKNGTSLPKFCNDSYHQICVLPKRDPRTPNDERAKLEVKLKFNRKRGKIFLNIYHPKSVLERLDDPSQDAVYCFTNADDTDLKTPLKIKRIMSKEAIRVYQIPVKYEHPGEYWCEVFDRAQTLIKSNVLIGYKKKKGNEYSLRMILRGMCASEAEESCTIIDGKLIMRYLDDIKFKSSFYHTDVVVRVMKIFGKVGNGTDVDLILHLTTLRKANVIGEYYKLFGFLHGNPYVQTLWFRSADYCLPTTTVQPALAWNLTALSEETCPDKLCLNEKTLPYKRKCLGTFIHGAHWENFTETCKSDIVVTEKTEELYNISLGVDLSSDTLSQLQNITTDVEDIIPLDVYLIANIMNTVHDQPVDSEVTTLEVLDNVMETIENLMNVNKTVLKESQIELNATDTLLDTIEKYLDVEEYKEDISSRLQSGEVFLSVKPKFILHITNPFVSGVHGLILTRNDEGEFFSDKLVRNILLDQDPDFDEVDDMELATYVPGELLDLIAEENGSRENITVITMIFFNDNLFNSEHEELGVPQSKVISVKIPDYGLYLDEPLPLIFRQANGSENGSCAYWQYGEYATNKTGHWSNLGGVDSNQENSTLTKCYFNHLTHFALLIMHQRLVVSEPEEGTWDLQDEFDYHNRILTLITLSGSILSVIGILGIFLTATCFARWRQKTGSKILLQLSLAILLEIVVVHVAGEEKLTARTQLCTIIGVCLHYVVLAKCSWMFVSAILQYLRFVKIFQVLPNRLILKAMLFSWGLPTIPVLAVGLCGSDYNAGARQFCYPVNLGLYLGLFAPVVLIVTCNLIVFVLIMKNIFNPNVEMKPRTSYKNSGVQNKLQIYLGILLFFMLGMPWAFGILAEILGDPLQLICMYLFCLTATLQGCVIFLFYVVLDEDTRRLWTVAFERLFR